MKNPLGEIYNSVKTSGNEKGTPTCIMKKAINLLSLKDRCKEELILLKDEMSALSSFFLDQIQVIESFVHKEVCNEEQKGLRSMALTKQIHYHNELQTLKKMWSGILELSVASYNIETFFQVENCESISSETPQDELLGETIDMTDLI